MVFTADSLLPSYCEAKLREKYKSSRPSLFRSTSSNESVSKDASRGDPPSPPPQPPPSPSNRKSRQAKISAAEKDYYGVPGWY
ncbi:hypothetical protein EV356DRAFT_531457 [Viridothelium virens]|uniref:Uncharacterized protein n=1 Tax=Viridothelium virens TaxID=1048519 RepID=A0A6A6HD40_VIRVR|nr:hypothetical protein EV356DRAFT_531457 [Viridothelium virens]